MAEPASPWVFEADGLASRLHGGCAALFPTDTLPALGALPTHAGQIWALKARPAHKPLILMGSDLAQLQATVGEAWHPDWLIEAERGWPGALTLVLPITGSLTECLHPGGHTLGLRVPACPQARHLLSLSGPLATTSANPSGKPAARDEVEAAASFPDVGLLGPLPWPRGSGQASTVKAWVAEGRWRILRQGALLNAP